MRWLIFAVVLALTSLALFFATRPRPGESIPKDYRKPQIEYQYNKKGWVGFKLRHEGQTKLITYQNDEEEDNLVVFNVLVLRLDDKDVVLGVGPDGKWSREKVELGDGPNGKKRRGHRHVWTGSDMELMQTVEIVPSKTGFLDACLVTFVVENKGTIDHKVGLRLLIDTYMAEDTHPFAVPGQKRPIKYHADFKDETVPDVVLALQKDNLKDPGLVATYTLNPGKGMKQPDRVAMTRYAMDEGEAFRWDFPVRDIAEDAALVFWWNPRVLEGGERAEVGFAVGAGEVDLDAPAKK